MLVLKMIILSFSNLSVIVILEGDLCSDDVEFVETSFES